jgi:hypothetical protein
MQNREYQIRATRRARRKLQGEQLDITFPRRGRPSRFRRLERAGQMSLALRPPTNSRTRNPEFVTSPVENAESPEAALDYLFPIGPMSEDQLAAEFDRLFPLE